MWRTLLCALSAGTCIWLDGCAKQAFPPGGPEDRTPPQIAASEPPSGSISVPVRAPVVLTFSEPMQREEVEKALNVFPAPTGGLALSWQGRNLRISPDTAWDSSRTYILTLQADARDLHNNRLARSLQIAFSTGASIDSGVVSGRILRNGGPAAGTTALLFRVDSRSADPEKDTADYVVTADSSGRFEFGYLGPGQYRIFGLDDRDRDWLWNVGVEPIAVPAFDARLLRPEDSALLPPLILSPLDTVMPAILDCRMAAPDMLQIDLSVGLDSSRLGRQHVSLKSERGVLPATRLYMLDTLADRFYAQFATAPAAGTWLVEVDLEYAGGGVRRFDTCEVGVLAEIHPSAPQPAFVVEPDSMRANLAWHPQVHLRLVEPARSTSARTLSCRSDNFDGVAPCTLMTPFTLALGVPEGSEGRGPVEFQIPAGFILWSSGGTWPAGDSASSVVVPFPFGDSVGQFEVFYAPEDYAQWPGYRIGMRAVAIPRSASWTEPAEQVPLRGTLRGGDYLLFVLGDRDGNLHRDPGWPFPYRPAEPLWELPDTLKVRARFTTELTLPPLFKKQLP